MIRSPLYSASGKSDLQGSVTDRRDGSTVPLLLSIDVKKLKLPHQNCVRRETLFCRNRARGALPDPRRTETIVHRNHAKNQERRRIITSVPVAGCTIETSRRKKSRNRERIAESRPDRFVRNIKIALRRPSVRPMCRFSLQIRFDLRDRSVIVIGTSPFYDARFEAGFLDRFFHLSRRDTECRRDLPRGK